MVVDAVYKFIKPATHLVILYADRSEFDRQQILPLIDADMLGNFLCQSRRFGTSISLPDYNQVIFRVCAAILKSHVIKSPNLIG